MSAMKISKKDRYKIVQYLFITILFAGLLTACPNEPEENSPAAPKSNKADITNLVVSGTANAKKETATGIITDTTITLALPFGTDNKAITLDTLTLSAGATANKKATDVLNFATTPDQTITVTAEDKITTKTYTLKLNLIKSSKADIDVLRVTIGGKTATGIIGDSTKITVPVTVPLGTVLNTATITALTLSEKASATPGLNGTLDFSGDVPIITVTAEDTTTTKPYEIHLVVTTTPYTITTYAGADITQSKTATLGQAIKEDPSLVSEIITIKPVVANTDFTWTVGTGGTAPTGTATSDNSGVLNLTKTVFASFANDDEKAVSISTNGATETVTITYKQYEIRAWQDLQAMRLELAGTYTQMNNITFPDENTDGKGDYNFEPIGRDTDPDADDHQGTRFTGNFDGNTFTIHNIYIKRTENHTGLFGFVDSGSKVRNVKLEGGSIEGGSDTGSIAGQNAGEVSGHSSVHVKGSPENTGGLIGRNDGAVYGYATGTVEGAVYIGGLVGENNAGGIVYGYATGNVKSIGAPTHRGVGGLVGENNAGGIVYGYATGDIKSMDIGTHFAVGGLVGSNNAPGGVVHGYATGDVSAIGWDGLFPGAGGLVGGAFSTTRGYARGEVERVSGDVLGFGLLAAEKSSRQTVVGFHSGETAESNLKPDALATATRPDTAFDGTAVKFSDGNVTKQTFEAGTFTFGEAVGQWTWIDGKWPAINLGNYPGTDIPISPAEQQPIDP